MLSTLRLPAQEVGVRCSIAAHAVLRASPDTLVQLRRQPVAACASLSASFMKHTEDQTVVALNAVLSVINDAGWRENSFADWGVVAGPSFLGRIGIAQSLQRYRKEGAWGVSPHLIPHQSLHAISGTISQALQIHGPNFGVGGGPDSGPDAFLLAATLLADGGVPGVWLVLTGYESEWIPAADGATPAPVCLGAALALAPADSDGRCLSICHARPCVSPSALYPDFQLASFLEELSGGGGQWRLSDSHWLVLDAEARP